MIKNKTFICQNYEYRYSSVSLNNQSINHSTLDVAGSTWSCRRGPTRRSGCTAARCTKFD